MTLSTYFYKTMGYNWDKILFSVAVIIILSFIKVSIEVTITFNVPEASIEEQHLLSYIIHKTNGKGFLLNLFLITALSYLRVNVVFQNENLETKIEALITLIRIVFIIRIITFFLCGLIYGANYFQLFSIILNSLWV
jgi:hypothetical protein